MKLKEAIMTALWSLWGHPLRTVLSILGIVIGVGGVIAIISMADGAKSKVMGEFSKIGGPSMIMVSSKTYTNTGGSWHRTPSYKLLTMKRAQELVDDSPHITAFAPIQGAMTRIDRGRHSANGMITATTPSLRQIMFFNILSGRFFNESEVKSAAKVGVLGYDLAKALFPHENPLGKEIRVAQLRFTVIGIAGQHGNASVMQQMDRAVFIPIETWMIYGRYPSRYIPEIIYKAASEESDVVDAALSELESAIINRYGSLDGFSVNTSKNALEAIDQAILILKLMLGGIASIALLVGGIGIMNIMLVSVTERTKEIGLRKALGARSKDVLTQFLVESIVLSLLGGLFGILSGYLMGLSISKLIEIFNPNIGSWPSVVTPSAMLGACLFSATVGIVFGTYPAIKASKLDPIVALRSE